MNHNLHELAKYDLPPYVAITMPNKSVAKSIFISRDARICRGGGTPLLEAPKRSATGCWKERTETSGFLLKKI